MYYCSCGNHDPDLFKAMDEYADFMTADLKKYITYLESENEQLKKDVKHHVDEYFLKHRRI